jgi:GH18 family chitinase
MKTVLNIKHIDGKVISEIEIVPDNYIQCSASGTYVHESEMQNEQGRMDRTNSVATYNMPTNEFQLTKAAMAAHKCSREYQLLCKKLEERIEINENSVPVQDVIDMLLKLQQSNPSARIVITQGGYYADGRFATIYGEPEKVESDVYSIGHSSQNY